MAVRRWIVASERRAAALAGIRLHGEDLVRRKGLAVVALVPGLSALLARRGALRCSLPVRVSGRRGARIPRGRLALSLQPSELLALLFNGCLELLHEYSELGQLPRQANAGRAVRVEWDRLGHVSHLRQAAS